MFDQYKGRIHLDLGTADLCEEDFYSPSISEKFKETNEDLRESRLKSFFPLIKENPKNFFEPRNVVREFCSVCGSDDEGSFNKTKTEPTSNNEDLPICVHCEKFEKIGTSFRSLDQGNSTKGLLWLWSNEDYLKVKEAIREPKKNIFDIFFSSQPGDLEKNGLSIEKRQKLLTGIDEKKAKTKNSFPFLKICLVNLEEIKNLHLKHSHFEFVNPIQDVPSLKGLSFGYRSIAFCDGLNLNKIANKAEGIRRIGILRMDVDNLGSIFIKGLNDNRDFKGLTQSDVNRQEIREGLSKQAALSRYINLFFTAYVPKLTREKFESCKIIYAGGDDLFAVGPWDKLPEMAYEIRKKFTEYCCKNPDLSLSAGIALMTEKYPLLGGACSSGEAEERAKNFDRGKALYLSDWKNSKKQKGKDALCFLDTVIGWEDYKNIDKFKENLKNLMDKTDSKSLLRVLYYIDEETKQERKQGPKNGYKPWRHRFVYNIARLIERHKGDENIKTCIYELKDNILNESQEDQVSNSKQPLAKNHTKGHGSVENKDKENLIGRSHPPYWLLMAVRWVDYLQRQRKGENPGNQKAG